LNIVTAYVDNEIVEAIDLACKRTGKSKSTIIKEALAREFASKDIALLRASRVELDSLDAKIRDIESQLNELRSKYYEKKNSVNFLQEKIMKEWINDQLFDIVELAAEVDVDATMSEFAARVESLKDQDLKRAVKSFVENGGEKTLREMIKKEEFTLA